MEKQIREFLRAGLYKIKFGWIQKQTVGLMDWDNHRIVINLDLMIVATFIHEYLHWKYPFKTEKEIIGKEEKAYGRLTVKQIRSLARLIRRTNAKRIRGHTNRNGAPDGGVPEGNKSSG